MKFKFMLFAVAVAAFSLTGCNQSDNNKKDDTGGSAIVAMYVAHLEPLNTNITHMNTTAQAKFIMTKDSLLVTIDVKGAPPGIEHWQHFHGFKDNKSATCPTMSADANGDGIIDLMETEGSSGTTMVPFNENPEKMDVGSNTYPKADSDSSYHYEARIPLDKLKSAFNKSFGDSSLNLESRVLYIHGVPENTKLPGTVASLGDIPAHVTLPIACGKIEKVAE